MPMSEPVPETTPRAAAPRRGLRAGVLIATFLGIILAGLWMSVVTVGAGQAIVVTSFGQPVEVIVAPGLAWTWPWQGAVAVDLRLHTESGAVQEVGTQDGLRVLVQAYAVWSVPPVEAAILQFVRGMQNDPAQASRVLDSAMASSLSGAVAAFDLTALVNTDPARLQLPALEDRLRGMVAPSLRRLAGIDLHQMGLERLSLPAATLTATVARMREEQESLAAQRQAEGQREAAQIKADAERDGRVLVADAQVQAAQIEAESRRQAAEIDGRAYLADPQLYMMLRSLDTLGSMIGPNTRLVLRTDAAPFNVLVQGPPSGASP